MIKCMAVIGEDHKPCENRATTKIVGYDYDLEIEYADPGKTRVTRIIDHGLIEARTYLVCDGCLVAIKNEAWLRHAKIYIEPLEEAS